MLIIINTLLFALVLFSVFTYWGMRKQRKILVEAQQEIQRIRSTLDGNKNSDTALPEPQMRLVVQVRDPISLAKRESISAQFIGDLLPELITKKVYQQIEEEIDEALKSQEIEADIKIEIY